MSSKLLSLNADLERLRTDGYAVQVRGSLLLVRDVPYVAGGPAVHRGILVTPLTLAGDLTRPPEPHIINFIGEFPCDVEGKPIELLRHGGGPNDLGHGVITNFTFSNKPHPTSPDFFAPHGFRDFHHKVTHYVSIISGPAAVIEPGINARTYAPPDDDDEEAVFNYLDTASDRAGLGALTDLLRPERVGIIGAGGSGAYIFDLVTKTPVAEVHLFDKDEFLQHNAFRAPGAPSLEKLRQIPLKVEYLQEIYSRMHRHIYIHPIAIDETNLDLLKGLTFVFLSLDSGPAKAAIIQRLLQLRVPFIDVGMGLELVDGSLGGVLRVTTATPEKHDHLGSFVSTSVRGEEDIYASNIQVAELNAMSAALAVIKWKKLRGFYRDLMNEHQSSYTIDVNLLTVQERGT